MDHDIFKSFRAHANAQRAQQMAAYMKNNFAFLGIPTPLRRDLSKEFLKRLARENAVNWTFVFNCFEQPEREFQYLALDYLSRIKKQIPPQDIANIEKLIQTKSWWDSVDGLDQVVGSLVLRHPELKNSHIRKWMCAENIWLKRVAIDFQLSLKELTDASLLGEVIIANFGSKEFFVNKAIGWSLRDYSKTNPRWVGEFITQHKSKLHPLSIREGSKYLPQTVLELAQ